MKIPVAGKQKLVEIQGLEAGMARNAEHPDAGRQWIDQLRRGEAYGMGPSSKGGVCLRLSISLRKDGCGLSVRRQDDERDDDEKPPCVAVATK